MRAVGRTFTARVKIYIFYVYKHKTSDTMSARVYVQQCLPHMHRVHWRTELPTTTTTTLGVFAIVPYAEVINRFYTRTAPSVPKPHTSSFRKTARNQKRSTLYMYLK